MVPVAKLLISFITTICYVDQLVESERLKHPGNVVVIRHNFLLRGPRVVAHSLLLRFFLDSDSSALVSPAAAAVADSFAKS